MSRLLSAQATNGSLLDHLAQDWKRPPREWIEAKTQFAIIFGERFSR